MRDRVCQAVSTLVCKLPLHRKYIVCHLFASGKHGVACLKTSALGRDIEQCAVCVEAEVECAIWGGVGTGHKLAVDKSHARLDASVALEVGQAVGEQQ